MDRINQLKAVKLQLLKNYNSLLLQQITEIDKENVESFEALSNKSDDVIANIIKIDTEIESNGIKFNEFNQDFKPLLLELDKNNKILLSKVETLKNTMREKRAKLKVGIKSTNKYKAYNKKTSYGFNILK